MIFLVAFGAKGVIDMRIWVDDVRPAPDGYVWAKSVAEAIYDIVFTDILRMFDDENIEIELIDMDHDAGDYAIYGGDYIKLLDWLEETGRNYPIKIHSQNVVGVQNMRAIIERNGWKEVK